MFGFAGKLLRVNLSTGEITRKPLSEELARNYLGGRGFAARILYDELEPGITPHMASHTNEALLRMAEVVTDVLAVIEGRAPKYPVLWP